MKSAKCARKTQKASPQWTGLRVDDYAGDHLISHTVTRAVPSAQRGLTSVFGMGTGDPSRYGHRQTWMALGRWFPAARHSDQLAYRQFLHIASPGANSKLAPNKFRTQTKIDWVLQDMSSKYVLKKKLKCSRYCAELILWTSRTGD